MLSTKVMENVIIINRYNTYRTNCLYVNITTNTIIDT